MGDDKPPDRRTAHLRGVTIGDVVDSYWIFLSRNRYDVHLELFKRRLNADQAAAEAEAIVFSLLWSAGIRPDIFEDPAKGGPDFCCEPRNNCKFLVEVTSLDSAAVAGASALPARITGGDGGAFSLITPLLRSKATSKASQFGNSPLPRLLAITSSHHGAGLLMDQLGAESLLVSDPMISSRLGDLSGRSVQVTDLRRSVFFKPGKSGREIVPCRRSISAILLVMISGAQTDVVGILHPDPMFPFVPSLFPNIPYLRVKDWPIVDGRINVEWIGDENRAATFFHSRIS